jgi:hypothetical protein
MVKANASFESPKMGFERERVVTVQETVLSNPGRVYKGGMDAKGALSRMGLSPRTKNMEPVTIAFGVCFAFSQRVFTQCQRG